MRQLNALVLDQRPFQVCIDPNLAFQQKYLGPFLLNLKKKNTFVYKRSPISLSFQNLSKWKDLVGVEFSQTKNYRNIFAPSLTYQYKIRFPSPQTWNDDRNRMSSTLYRPPRMMNDRCSAGVYLIYFQLLIFVHFNWNLPYFIFVCCLLFLV